MIFRFLIKSFQVSFFRLLDLGIMAYAYQNLASKEVDFKAFGLSFLVLVLTKFITFLILHYFFNKRGK